MPVNPTYPGVYIDELPSAVRTITGVPTSIAAFVGWAPSGPDDRPVHVTSFADYERVFGGLHAKSPMSHAVHQFYLNGGSEAEIVRLAGGGAKASTTDLGDGVKLEAASKGVAGDKLRARVDHDTGHADGPAADKYYNLAIRDTGTGVEERYLNICVDAAEDPSGAHRIDNVLASSRLVVWKGTAGGLTARPDAHDPVPPGGDPFADDPDGKRYKQASGGADGDDELTDDDYNPENAQTDKRGIYALLKAAIFNMLCLPGVIGLEKDPRDIVLALALELCNDERAMLLVDPPDTWNSVSAVADDLTGTEPYLSGDATKNAAVYFPNVVLPDPLLDTTRAFPPCGVMAGVWARTDVQRGVWKAPAGTDASLAGVRQLAVPMTDLENGRLNPLGVNCLRSFPVIGPVSWGARTMRGADRLADQWKYLPVRRLALFIEESLFRGTQWVVFEPNDEPLWSSIRQNVGAFMNNLFRQGAFQGQSPEQAYLVKCDSENNPQYDIDRGIVNIGVGFAPLKPAEFVVIHIQQLAGQAVAG